VTDARIREVGRRYHYHVVLRMRMMFYDVNVYHGVTHYVSLHAFNFGASPDSLTSYGRLCSAVGAVVANFRELSLHCLYRPRELRKHEPECPLLLKGFELLFLCITGYRDRIFAFSSSFSCKFRYGAVSFVDSATVKQT
jgi:hypothetical protein